MFVINNPLNINNMSRGEKIFTIAVISAIVIAMLIMVFSDYDYLKETEFSSEFEPGTDSYMEDSLSYVHPDWTYEQICDTLYGPEEDAY